MTPQPTIRRVALISVVVTALVVLLCGGTGMALIGGLLGDKGDAFTTMTGCGNGELVNVGDNQPQVGGLDPEQVRNAAVIIQVGQKMKLPPRAWVIAVATALQESHLRNLGHLGANNDHDSLGLFQQRPSQGWGSPEQLLDPAYSARKFYEKLRKIKGWERMRLTDAAQRVQRSAFPDAYQKWESTAAEVVNAVTGGAARSAGDATVKDVSGGGELDCASFGTISASGWTAPAKGSVGDVNGFRSPQRRNHQGIDIVAPRGSAIRAASGGIVITVECNASTGNCDVDGSPRVLGCGWYVDVLHADNVITRYCHMLEQPLVSVGDAVEPGQTLGKVGSSGNSSGPHLHFEVHLNRDPGPSGAIDPIPFMAAKGAALRG